MFERTAKTVRFNASEIGEALGLLSQYKPNTSLPRIICRDAYAPLSKRYGLKMFTDRDPMRLPASGRAASTSRFSLDRDVFAAVIGNEISRIADVDAEDMMDCDDLPGSEEADAGRPRDFDAVDSVLSFAEKAKAVPGFIDMVTRDMRPGEFARKIADGDVRAVSDTVDRLIEMQRPEIRIPEPVTAPCPAVSSPPVPMPMASPPMPVVPPPSLEDREESQLKRAKHMDSEAVRFVLDTMGDTKKTIRETVTRNVYTRHGIRNESRALARVAETLGEPIDAVDTVSVTLTPEDIYDFYDIYTDVSLKFTGRPDGRTATGNRYIEVKNRINRILERPAHYEMPQVQVYALMQDCEPVIFVEQHKATGKLSVVTIPYDDAKMRDYVIGLVAIAEYTVAARSDPEKLKELAVMSADDISRLSDSIIQSFYRKHAKK